MSKRIVLGGLLAVGLSLAVGGAAQAQHPHHGGPGRGGFGGGVYAPVYRPVVVAPPIYRPVVVNPAFGYGPTFVGPTYVSPVYGGINSPYFGFGSGYVSPVYGIGSGAGILNLGYSRPGFSIGFGTIIR